MDSVRAESLERMRADVEERERRLRALSEQLNRDGRMNELQRQRSSKHIRQVWPTCAPRRACGIYCQLNCNPGSSNTQ